MADLMRRSVGYNLINALQVALAAAFHVLLARTFGASLLTDVYLASLLFINFMSTLAASLAEMFIQYYHEIKRESEREATHFYQAVLNVSLLVGLLTCISAVAFCGPLLRMLAPGFDAERLDAMRSVFSILALSLMGSAAVRVNTTLLRAEMRFLPTYLLGLLTPGLNVVAILVFGATYGITVIACAGVVSTMLGLVVQQAYIMRALEIRWAPRLRHPRLGGLAANSVLLRLGHQIWDFKDVVATNVLSALPGGTVSLYFYGARVIGMAFSVTTSAGLDVLLSMTSRLASDDDVGGMRALHRRSVVLLTGLFTTALVVLVVLLPDLLAFFVGARLSDQERATIYSVFLTLIPFYLILSVEMPLVTIAVVMRQGARVAIIGAAFILIYWMLALWLRPRLGVYAIPTSMAAAQMHSLMWYWVNGRRILRRTGGAPTPADTARAA